MRKHTSLFCGSLSDGEKKLNKIDTKAKLDSNMDLWAENHAFANWKKEPKVFLITLTGSELVASQR